MQWGTATRFCCATTTTSPWSAFNRPDRHNAANDALDAAFFAILDDLHHDDAVRAIVLRGEGPSFSSGRDMTELGARPEGISDYEFIEQGHAKTKLLLSMPAPIIVALKGWVIGGSFERALLCDLRIAATDARFRLPEVMYGVIPDSTGVARLFQMSGHGIVSDLVLTGRTMDATEALSHGIVSRVVGVRGVPAPARRTPRLLISPDGGQISSSPWTIWAATSWSLRWLLRAYCRMRSKAAVTVSW